MLDFSALTAELPSDSASGLWVSQPRRRHRQRRRRRLVAALVTTAVAVVGVAAALVAPRFLDNSHPAASGSTEPSTQPESSPSPPSSATTAASPTAAAGPVIADVSQRGVAANLSPDGSRLVLVGAGSAPGTAPGAGHIVTTYDTTNGEALARIVGPPVGGEITDVVYSPNGATIAFATTTSLVLVDLASSSTRDIAGPAGLAGAAFSGIEFLDGGTAVVALAQTAAPQEPVAPGGPGGPGGQAQGTSRLVVFDTASGGLVHDLGRNPTAGTTPRGSTTATSTDVVADPTGRLLAVLTPDTVEFWDRSTVTQFATVPASSDGRRYFAAPAAWRADGRLMTCLGFDDGDDGEVPRFDPVVVDPVGGKLVPLAIDGASGIGPCAFDTAGALLAAQPDPATRDVVVWDVARDVERTRVTVRGEAVEGVAARPVLSGDGQTFLVFAGDDVQVWTLPRPG